MNRSAEVIDLRTLREHLEREAATHQELGDDRSEGADETGWHLAHEAWGAARAYREVIKYIDHELETR